MNTTAIARPGDPATSHAAAASVNTATGRAAVLRVMQSTGWFDYTDEELCDVYKFTDEPRQSDSGIRTRRSELARTGLVEWTGQYRPTRSGRSARTWRVT